MKAHIDALSRTVFERKNKTLAENDLRVTRSDFSKVIISAGHAGDKLLLGDVELPCQLVLISEKELAWIPETDLQLAQLLVDSGKTVGFTKVVDQHSDRDRGEFVIEQEVFKRPVFMLIL